MLDFENGVFSAKNLVDTLHGCHTLLDAVACLRDFLQRLKGGVEDGEIEDEGAGIDG